MYILETVAMGRRSIIVDVAIVGRYRWCQGLQGTACSDSFEVYVDSCCCYFHTAHSRQILLKTTTQQYNNQPCDTEKLLGTLQDESFPCYPQTQGIQQLKGSIVHFMHSSMHITCP
jgi:hypothetical protein